MGAEPPKRKRRWFQFSLRSLLIFVTLLAVACGYVAREAEIVRKRNSLYGLNEGQGDCTLSYVQNRISRR
jgi:hypothetical protein